MRSVARWIFFATLAFAPWAYGATTAISIETINWLLLTTLLLWVVELAINRRKPQFPRAVVVIVFCLLGVGGWMAVNAFSIYDGAFHSFAPLRNFSSGAPGSVDFAISAAWMIRAALLLGVVLFVSDLSQDNVWLLRLWQSIGIVADSIALLGLLQKATGAGMIFWQEPSTRTGTTFFSWSKSIDVRTLFNSYAGMLNLDVERFKKDMDGEQASESVAADQKQGASLGVQNTPTIFLNNRAVDPKSLNPDALRTQVEDAVKAKSPSS